MANQDSPTIAQLIDWLEGRLAEAEGAAVASAVGTDPALQEQVAWLRDFFQISDKITLADPPAGVHQAANAAFAAYARAKRPPGLLRTLIATLTSDNWQRLSLAGVRNVTLRNTPRQLVYSSDLADVALNVHVQGASETIDLDGQIFPLDESDPGDFVVQLLQDGVERRLVTSDALGKFSFTDLSSGAYLMYLSSDEGEIEIGPVDLL